MSGFLKKVLWVGMMVLVFNVSVGNVLAVCDLSKLSKNLTGTLDTGASTCKRDSGDGRGIFSNINSDKIGTYIATCENNGQWSLSPACNGLYICVRTSSVKAECVSANTRCTDPDGAPNRTLCRNGNILRCDGFTGTYFQSETCKDGTVCMDLDGPARCVKKQCTQDGKSRNIGESACFGDYLNTCESIGEDKDPKFTKNSSETLCKFGCVEKTQFAECLSNSSDKNNICKKDGKTWIKGETDCINGILMECSKNKPGEFAVLEDCEKIGKRCDIIDKYGNGKCVDSTTPESKYYVPSTETKGNITNAFCENRGPGTTDPAINTALGCIPIQMKSFMAWLLPWVFGIAGGIAFLLMIYGFILMANSKGDPKAIQGAQETVTSAIVGLLVSVFSLFILRLVLADILKIPGIG